jgi:hypothetical protein
MGCVGCINMECDTIHKNIQRKIKENKIIKITQNKNPPCGGFFNVYKI